MKYIKKLFCLLAAVTLLTASLMPIKASAASPVSLSVSSASGKKGDRVTVNLNISGNSGAYAVKAGVRFDTNKLKFISAAVGSAGGKMEMKSAGLSKQDASVVVFSGMNSSAPLTASGTLMQITFEILMTSGSASLSVTGVDLVDASYNDIACSTSGGIVTFKAPPPTVPPTKPPTQPPTKPPTKPTAPPTKPTEAPTKPTGATETANGSTSETATENSSEIGSLPTEENTYFSTEPNTDTAENTENAENGSDTNEKNPIKLLSEWASSVPARVSKVPMAFRVSGAVFGTAAVLFGTIALYFFLKNK